MTNKASLPIAIAATNQNSEAKKQQKSSLRRGSKVRKNEEKDSYEPEIPMMEELKSKIKSNFEKTLAGVNEDVQEEARIRRMLVKKKSHDRVRRERE